MSTLKTHNLQSPDAGSVNIALAPNAGMVVTGISTFTGDIDVDGHTNLDNVSIAGIVTTTDSSYHQYYALGTSTVGGIRFGNNTQTNGYIYYDNGANMNFHAGGSERVRITSVGRLGIGDNSPDAMLHVTGSDNVLGLFESTDADSLIQFKDNSTSDTILMGALSGDDLLLRCDAGNIVFHVANNNEKVRINSSGNLGIGESSSIDARLHVNSGTDNATLFLESTDGDVNLCMADNAGSCRLLQAGGNLRFRTGGNANVFGTGDTERMVLDGNGRLLLGTTTEGLGTYGENFTIGSVGNGGMTIRTGTGNKGTVYFSDGTSGAAEYKGSIQYDHSDDSLRLAAGGSVRLRVESTGEVRMLPSTSGNTNTQFSFNNVASTPFISIKSNNLSEAAELRFEEDNGGANIIFKNKNTSGQLYTNLEIKNKGSIFTTEDGSVKSYPIIMGTDTQHDAHEGMINYHDFRAPTAQIGGWVFLGHDYGPAPYPVRRFKIAVPQNSQGTLVYQVWHNGDANYDYGGLYEIRINQWANSSRFESVSIRCINGHRTDLRVVAYNNTNGIMIQTSTIWGSVYIRKAGWDDGARNPGSSNCAVANNGALAIYNGLGTDDGAMPTSGSPVDVYCFDGAGGSHTGGRDIENSNSFNG